MPLFALCRRTCLAIMPFFALAACDNATEVTGGNTVEMRDMEVVDGTTTDAMTDLDGVRAEGTALVASNSATNAASPQKAGNAADVDDSAEVVASE